MLSAHLLLRNHQHSNNDQATSNPDPAAGAQGRRNSQDPSPTAMLMSVSTSPFPLFGIVHSLALYKSYPAAKALPLVGVLARGDSFLTKSGGEVERGGGGAGAGLSPLDETERSFEAMAADWGCSVLARLAKGELGREGGKCDDGEGVDMVCCGSR